MGQKLYASELSMQDIRGTISDKRLKIICPCCVGCPFLNPLPDNKILDQTKLKAFADYKLNVTKIIISVFDRVENIVGKGEWEKEKLLVQVISPFPTMFSKDFFPRCVKRCHCVGMC